MRRKRLAPWKYTLATIFVALYLISNSGIVPLEPAHAQTVGGSQVDCWGDYKSAVIKYAGDALATLRTYEERSYWQRTFNPAVIGGAELAALQYYAQAYSAWWQYVKCSALPTPSVGSVGR